MLAAAGRYATAAEIAAQLHLSEGTVRNYLSAAMRKLGARTSAQAVAIGLINSMFDYEPNGD